MSKRARRHIPFGVLNTGAFSRLPARPGRLYLALWMIGDAEDRVPRDPRDIKAMTGLPDRPSVFEQDVFTLLEAGLIEVESDKTLHLVDPDIVRMGGTRQVRVNDATDTREVREEYATDTREVREEYASGTRQVRESYASGTVVPNDSMQIAQLNPHADGVRDRVRDRDREGDAGARATRAEQTPSLPEPPPLRPRSAGAEETGSLLSLAREVCEALHRKGHPCDLDDVTADRLEPLVRRWGEAETEASLHAIRTKHTAKLTARKWHVLDLLSELDAEAERRARAAANRPKPHGDDLGYGGPLVIGEV